MKTPWNKIPELSKVMAKTIMELGLKGFTAELKTFKHGGGKLVWRPRK